jgi:glycosyltransferase involved in cell wall biosynthesis
MQIDVVIPTYNREYLLRRLLESLLRANIPASMLVTIWIVDNNSSDGTPATVQSFQPPFHGRLQYVLERRQGKAHALNSGILAGNADLIGFLDDDEEVDANWFTCIASVFEDQRVDFVGGPYRPRWSCDPPRWLPSSFRAVVGWVDGGSVIRHYGDPDFPAILMGGNAVIRRRLLAAIGLFDVSLGAKKGKSLLTGEDDDVYRRLLESGGKGIYHPDLTIYHYVPPERLTKSYHRRWAFWQGVGLSVLSRKHDKSPAKAPCALGVPRWYYRQALQGLMARLGTIADRDSELGFTGELHFFRLCGLLYGRHLHRPRS